MTPVPPCRARAFGSENQLRAYYGMAAVNVQFLRCGRNQRYPYGSSSRSHSWMKGNTVTLPVANDLSPRCTW
jgi:hypothetical protein